jgi:uncharacterized protein
MLLAACPRYLPPRSAVVPFRILTVDGGGIRGVLPAAVLRELERLTERPVHELFDLIVGTSTGAVLGLGLTTPGPSGGPRYTADDLVSLYLDEGPDIFSRSLAYRVRTGNGVTNAKYPASGIETVLERYFGGARLSESLGDVLVTAYETELREPFLFRSRRARTDGAFDFLTRDVARAVTAAPTFFPPARLTGDDGQAWSLIDGGVYANNPTMVGVVEALAAYGADDVLSLSLGTGDLTRPLPYEQIRSWGLLQWARPVIDIVFDGVARTVDFQAGELARSTGEVGRHTRLNVRLTTASDDIDDASPGNLLALQRLAKVMVTRGAEELEQVAEVLLAGGPASVDGPRPAS